MKTKSSVCLSLLSLALSTAAFASGPAESIYKSLSSREEVLEKFVRNDPVDGVGTMQKSGVEAGGPAFCRKDTPVVPNPKSTYECFYARSDGPTARDEYLSSDIESTDVLFTDAETGSVRAGGHWAEKRIGQNELCVETAPVVPHPIASYVCYSTSPLAGGAVSGSN